MVNLEIWNHLCVIYLGKSMAGDPFQSVDAILCHSQWPSTVTLRSARSNSTPTSVDSFSASLIKSRWVRETD